MAFVQADLDRIEKAMGQGVMTVHFSDGRSVTFSSFKELTDRWHFIAKQLGLSAGRQRMFAEYRKGTIDPDPPEQDEE